VSVQAHTDQLEILADKEVTVISVNDGIEVKASKRIVLQAGQASITLEGQDITFACPGTFSVKGGQHVFDKGASGAAVFNGPSDRLVNLAPYPASYSQQINIAGMLENDRELAGAHYEIWTKGENGRLLARGTISADALSERVFTDTPEEIEIIVGDNEWGHFIHEQANWNDDVSDKDGSLT
jgi:type VI secretion system secreted protein VgrG